MDYIWLLAGFNAFVLAMLAVDLGVFHRNPHPVSIREATAWSALWICLSLLFAAGVYHWMGPRSGLEFLTAYLIEKALSVDNIFVFVVIFSYFAVPPKYQHRILLWGVLGALVMRGAMIGAGAYLLHRFEWIMYVFGAFLVLTGIRMALQRERRIEPQTNPVLRLMRRVLPVTDTSHGQKFFVRGTTSPRRTARWLATPLFVVLVLVETTDLVFAFDSIPAVFAVTQDPFIVYTSNILAILGLRSLYFLLAGVVTRFRYLKPGLSAVLIFVGAKMLVEDVWQVPIGASLAVVAAILVASVSASIILPRPPAHPPLTAPGMAAPEPAAAEER